MKIKFNRKDLIKYIVIFLFVPPDIMETLLSLKTLHQIAVVGSYVFSSYFIFKCFTSKAWKKACDDRWLKLVIALVVLRVVSSIANGTYYLTAALHQVTMGCFAMWNFRVLKEDDVKISKIYRNIMFIYLQLNAASCLLATNGFDPTVTGDGRVWILGTKNGSTLYTMLYIICSCYCLYSSNYKRKKLKLNAVFAVCLIDAIILSSSTLILSILATYLIILAGIIASKRIKGIVSGMGKIVAVIILFCIISVCFGDSSGNSLMETVALFLGKDTTFSGRVAIWQQAIRYFQGNPLWGQGLGLYYDVWGNNMIVYSAHNALLSSLAVYGIFTSIIWLLSVVYTGIFVFKTVKNEVGIATIACYIGTIISTISEANDVHICLLLSLLFIYHIARVNQKKKVIDSRYERKDWGLSAVGGVVINCDR